MKHIVIKIIFCFCIVISMNACHTFEHQNIFIQDINEISKKEFMDKKDKKAEVSRKKSTESERMAPIDMPKQTQKVQKLTLQKQAKKIKATNFNLNNFVNWDEDKLIETLGNGHFIKKEGVLKNYQYYLKKCFVDIFLLKKNGVYLVNYVETRPTKLNGKININDCLKEIKQILK